MTVSRRVAVLLVVGLCAVALAATSPRERRPMTNEVTGRALAAVTLAPWTVDAALEVEHVFRAEDVPDDLEGETDLQVAVIGGIVDDGSPLPTDIPLTAASIGDDGALLSSGPDARPDAIWVSHLSRCRADTCRARFRVRVLRPDDFPPHLGLEVRLSLAGSIRDHDDDPSLPADAVVELATKRFGEDEPVLVPPPTTSAPAVTLTLPRPDGIDGLAQAVLFTRPQPGRTPPVLVSVVGDAPGTVVLARQHTERSFRIPVGESLAIDPFDDLEGRYVHTEPYTVHLEIAGAPAGVDRQVTVEFRVGEGVTAARGHFGTPTGAHLELRTVDAVHEEAEGTVELSPTTPRQVVAHVLEVADGGAPFTGTLVVGAGASATYHPPEGQPDVRIEFVTPDHVRRLTPVHAYDAVGRYLTLDVVDGIAQEPIELTFVLEGDQPTTVRWELDVRLDPLRTDTPQAVEAVLVPVDP